jgi:alcohol dehydrogenase class IV
MAYASLCGGLALANARLGAVHGFASPLGGAFPVPHGAACAALMAPVAAANIAALRARDPRNPALARYGEAASMLTGDKDAWPEDVAPALGRLASELGIRGLASFGVAEADIPGIARRAESASSMRGNPILLLPDELDAIVRAAL